MRLRTKALPGMVAIALLMLLGGCSYVPDWASPVSWYDDVVGNGNGSESAPPAEGEFPNLSDVPERPRTSTDPGESDDDQSGLTSDRDNVRYTNETVRGRPSSGSAAASSTPPAGAPDTSRSAHSGTPAAPRPAVKAAELKPPAVPVAAVAPVATPQPAPSEPPAAPPASPVEAKSRPAPSAAASPSPGPPASTLSEVYSSHLQESAPTVTTASPLPTRAEGSGGAAGTTAPPPSAPVPPPAVPAGSSQIALAGGGNLTQPTLMPAPVAGRPALPPSAPALKQPPEVITVRFENGSAELGANDLAKLKQVAAQYRRQGGGTVRVIGHASSRTRDMPVADHKLANFNISMERAENVARALTKLGIDRGAILLEARSDSDPIYDESMPRFEEYNRRAEIFLEN